MTRMRARALTIFLAVVAVAAPAAALAQPYPTYDGAMSFQAIQGPEGPEEFSWEVGLGEEQELRQIDEEHAGVYYEDGTPAFAIDVVLAHDAEGTAVPTTLAVTQPNIITLTVHHRAGNPAAGGAPFEYPVVGGEGWEGGFHTTPVILPPGDPLPSSTPQPSCVVPRLAGKSIKASRRTLKRARCRLGTVWGDGGRGAKAVKQYRRPGRTLPAYTSVDIKLGG